MDQLLDAQSRSGFGDVAGARGMDILKTLTACEQQAREIDHGAGALQGGFDLFRLSDVAFDQADLTHLAQRTQEKAPIGVTGSDLDAPAGLGQSTYRMASQKAGTAEYCDLFCFHGENPVGRARV